MGFLARWGLARWAMARWGWATLPPATSGQPFGTPDMTGGFRSGSMNGGMSS